MKKIFISVVAVIVILIAAAGIAVMTFDINKHRGPIETALSQKIGRTVKLTGDIHIGVAMAGLTMSIKDAAFGNPDWASRPQMASLKRFDLKVGLLPLLEHKIDITGISIDNADILLESASGNRHNWDVQIASATPEPTATAAKTGSSEPVAINITSLSIKNSQIGVRGEDGKVTLFKADELTLGRKGTGTDLDFSGSLNDLPIKLTLLTNADAIASKTARPVDLDLNFANYHLTAKGTATIGNKSASFDSYELTSGDTKIAGKLAMEWGGVRPVLQGTVTSDNLVPADLKMSNGKETAAEEKSAADDKASASPHIFNDNPLALGALKSADVDLDIAIGTMPAGSVELKDIKSKIIIKEGHLLMSPLSMVLGSGTIDGLVNLDASNPDAKFNTKLVIDNVDLTDLIKAGGAQAFLSGKVKADINLASHGNSMHEFASNLNGPINLIGAGGDVLSSTSDQIASGLAQILSPGIGNQHSGMNCVVARFIAENGFVKGNGILIDTGAATAAGFGDIDLRSETLNLDFHAKSKLVNIGGLVPPLHIGGTLKQPEANADAKSVIQNVGQMLLGGTASDGVPDVVTQQGQNACAFALDHPSVASATPDKGGVVQKLLGKASGSLTGGSAGDLAAKAGSALKGLFGQ